MPSWDDLQLVKAVGDGRSMAAAARQLSVDYSTVFRRLNALEKELGVRLFDRSRTACTATAAGERMLQAADEVTDSVDAALLEITGRDAQLSGTVRVATTPSFAQFVLSPLLPGFAACCPDVKLEVLESYAVYNLMHREADIAFRYTRKPPENLVGQRVGVVGTAVYGAPDYLHANRDRPLAELRWVSQVDDTLLRAERQWLTANIPERQIVTRMNYGPATWAAIRSGLGVGLLVNYMGRSGGLEQLGPSIPSLDDEVWMLTHPSMRQVARLRAFMNYMREALAREHLRYAPDAQTAGT